MNEPILIPMEDDLIHTDERPFCDDTTCPCHEQDEEEKEYESMCQECERVYRGDTDYFASLYEASAFLPCGHYYRDLVDLA